MFTFNVDLGQLIIVTATGVIGWFINRTVKQIDGRLDKHDEMIYGLIRDIGELTGNPSFGSKYRKSTKD